MSRYSPWKALERRHAKRLGGKRLWRPDFGESIPDGETDEDTWDCKAYARFSVISMFIEAERKYRAYANGRRFHLCLFGTQQKGAGDFVLLRADDYESLSRAQQRAKEAGLV